jgi:hypothetical protein
MPKKEKEEATLPRGRLYFRRPSRTPPLEEKKVAKYLHHEAALRRPNDPEDSPGFAKTMAESVNDMLTTDEVYAKWWSAIDSGTVIDLDKDGGESIICRT